MGVALDRYLPGRNAMLGNESYVTRDKLQSFFHKYPLVDMIIYFTFIAIEIKVIDNINLAVLFSGVERYHIAFIIITPIVWNPFRVAACGVFYIDSQDAVIIFNS